MYDFVLARCWQFLLVRGHHGGTRLQSRTDVRAGRRAQTSKNAPSSAARDIINRMSSLVESAEEGCYEASRAAALSGVPISTVYHWARTGLVVPSVSPVKERLWSYADLLTLRVISWLRHPKPVDAGQVIARAPMPAVKAALELAASQGVDLWGVGGQSGAASSLKVDRTGTVWVQSADDGFLNAWGDHLLQLEGPNLDLLAPFTLEDRRGPHLVTPKPHLRIVPAKVAGEPHVKDSRITSRSLAALAARGVGVDQIGDLYGLPASIVTEAVDLEAQLNPTRVAA